MLISIIIPIYNVEEFIEECLESVYQQTYSDIEVILVNDCTIDNSMKIAQSVVRKYMNKYPTTIIEHEWNKGLSESRNSGMNVAKGEYIYFVDSDDVIIPEAVELLANVANMNKDIQLVEGKHFQGTAFIHNPIDDNPCKFKIYNDEESQIKFLERRCMTVWNILLKRSFIQEHSIRFIPNLLFEDNVFCINIAEYLSYSGEILVPTYFYRKNENSITNTISSRHFDSTIQNLIYIKDNLFTHKRLRKLLFNRYISLFFLYWQKKWRDSPEHSTYYPILSKTTKTFIKKNFKELGVINLIYLSPILFPYIISKYYIKIIWTIRTFLK